LCDQAGRALVLREGDVGVLLGTPSLSQAAAALGTTHQNARQLADALQRKGFLQISTD
jgi:hypothetical protein